MTNKTALAGAIITILLTMTLTSGCTAAAPRDFIVLEQGSAAMTTENYTFAVALRQNDWLELYEKIHAHRLPRPVPPNIDWSTHMVVFVAAGWKPSAGYRIDIPRIEQAKNTLKVFVALTEPPPGSAVATVMTQPYAIAVVEKSGEPDAVEFFLADGRPLGTTIHLSPENK